ncbi:site-specific integrase [Labilibacter marinus]|uniref:site-specific integrase n=1 Tax=Labilibacter marinus TaxID=1477105 RepID=UPI00082F17AC|nr:site-specific integrase [Labilibacter marinus]
MTTNATFNISFISRVSKTKPEQATIYSRISINGKRVEFSIIKHIPTNSWQSAKEIINHTYKDFRKANAYINQVRSQLTSIYRELILSKKLVSPSILKNHFFGNEDQGRTLLHLIDYHYKTQSQILSTGTLSHYRTSEKYIKKFISKNKKTDDVYLHQLGFQFITEFDSFLRQYQPTNNHRPMSHNVVMKHLARLKKLINLAIKLDWMQKNPFDSFQMSYTKVDRGFLTELELKTIISKPLTIKRLDYVRDLFIFACYTGLAYIDVQQLQPENLVIGIDGDHWIQTQRQKTNTSLMIPLLPIAIGIISKYKNNPKAMNKDSLFPAISNSTINIYLKEIADMCGINKNITFHMARHTFATTITLSNGVPIETVSKILGHTDLATTQIYAKVLQNKISNDMSVLKEKLYKKNDQPNTVRKFN